MSLWVCRQSDKIRCICSSHQTVFLLSNLADPSSTLSTQHAVFWKRVSCTSKLFPQHPYSTCVCLTGSGLNYLSGFSWMSSPYSLDQKSLLFAEQAHSEDSSHSEICKFSCWCLHSSGAAAYRLNHKIIKLNPKYTQNFIGWTEALKHTQKQREGISVQVQHCSTWD